MVYLVLMEQLKNFLKPYSVDDRKAFADRCGTTYAFLRNVMYGQRQAGEKLCVAIERESSRFVTRRDLRPHDWHLIWPELMSEKSRHRPSADAARDSEGANLECVGGGASGDGV